MYFYIDYCIKNIDILKRVVSCIMGRDTGLGLALKFVSLPPSGWVLVIITRYFSPPFWISKFSVGSATGRKKF